LTNFESKALLARLGARGHFWAYCYYMNPEFFEKRRFLKDIAIILNELINGDLLRVSVSLPPRAGKSYLATLLASYTIGKFPEESVMRNSCTATLYNKFSYDVRDIVKSDKFKSVFPEVNLKQDKQAVTGWNVDQAKQVTYFGNGVGGTIIGFGASKLSITDDLYKSHEEALSETINDKTHRWFESAHMSRLEKGCKELDIGTRWHKGDVIGVRMENKDYDKSISISAMIDGETFCEDVKTTEEYIHLRNRTDKFIWVSEYMQQPIDSEGLVFPESELMFYDQKNTNKGYKVAFIDTADKGEDYLSMPIVEYFHESGEGYLIDVLFNLNELHINEDLIIQKCEEHQLDLVVVETNKEGGLFVNNLRQKTKVPIYGQFNSSNKITRILSQSGYIKTIIKFKKEDMTTEYGKFMRQLTTYLRTGNSKHDDAPDSLAGVMSTIRKNFQYD